MTVRAPPRNGRTHLRRLRDEQGLERHQLPFLEARHRTHARVEDRVKAIKQTGMGRFPLREFGSNQVWLQLALCWVISKDSSRETLPLA